MDFIYENKSSLDPEFCKSVIKKFINDDRKKNNSIPISRFIDWEGVTNSLDEILKNSIEEYKNFVRDKIGVEVKYLNDMNNTGGYIVSKMDGSTWHSDFKKNPSDTHTVSYVWFLNTRKFDGETDFIYKKVKPEAGKLIMFPATWNSFYMDHPSEEKYIITGWLSNNK